MKDQEGDMSSNENRELNEHATVLSITYWSYDKTIRIWDAETGDAVGQPLKGHTDSIHSVAYSPNGQYIISGSCDKTIRTWDAETGAAVGQPLEGTLRS
jgi:WD40 repeat protein